MVSSIYDSASLLKQEDLDGQVSIQKDEILKTEFYIEIESEQLSDDVRRILNLACKERNWNICGGLIGEDPRIPVIPSVKPKSGKIVINSCSLDLEVGQPIKVLWDDGHLDLKNVILPSRYAQCLWRLSSPTDIDNRVRYVEPNRRIQVEKILSRLGCQTI